jgi:ATP/maltotriose-dependent transcriptional regulator MalT
MIKNEHEYRVTNAQTQRFERALSQLAAPEAGAGLHPLVQRAQREAVQSQLDELREEIAEYDSLRCDQYHLPE